MSALAATVVEAAAPDTEVVTAATDKVVNSAEGTEPAQAGTVPTMVVAPEGAQAAPETAVPAVGTVPDIEPSDASEPEALARAADVSTVAEAATPEPEVSTLATDEVMKSAGGAESTQACNVLLSTEAYEPTGAGPETGAPPVATVPATEPSVASETDASVMSALAATAVEAAAPDAEVATVATEDLAKAAGGVEPMQTGTVDTMAEASELAAEPDASPISAVAAMVTESAAPHAEVATVATDEVAKSAGGAEPTQAGTVPSSTKAYEPTEAAPETGAPPVATVPTTEPSVATKTDASAMPTVAPTVVEAAATDAEVETVATDKGPSCCLL